MNIRSSLRYYPLFLDVSGKRCVVVGGGRVALRKILKLLECGAKVVVVSPSPVKDVRRLAGQGKITLCARKFRNGDLRGSVLAIGATDDKNVNKLVNAEAAGCAIPVNVVDDIALSTFIVPSIVRRGNLIIAVSTLGESPAFSREVRIELDRLYGGEFGKFLALIGGIRRHLKEAVPSEKKRARLVKMFVRDGMTALRKGEKVVNLRKMFQKRLAILEEQ